MADLLISAIRPDPTDRDRYVEAVRVDEHLLDIAMILNWLEKPGNKAFAKRYDGPPIEVRIKRDPKSSFGPTRWLVTHPDGKFLPEVFSITRC
ncbi:MAG: hypothetical protein ACREBO_10765 [Novosphingobium sp.]